MYNEDLIKKLYRSMLLIRLVEQHLVDVYATDAVKSPVHLSIGQESIAAGICEPLSKEDFVANTYRCHATYIAKGGNLKQMIAELYGKADGCARGKAGSMHLIDMPNGVMGASAVVGTTIPVAAGYALALKREAEKTGKQRVVVAVFGDGATEEGCFYETLNFASLHKLPILFVCENNRLAIHTPLEKRWATPKLCERVETFDIPAKKIEDGDIFRIYDETQKALSTIRAGQGPMFMECHTYRWLEHVGPTDDHHEEYRDKAILEKWKANDQIARLAKMLSESDRLLIEKEVNENIAEAVEFAKNSPFPANEELYDYVYAD